MMVAASVVLGMITVPAFADSDGNEFAQCTYADAGPCAYFFADGSFSSGSSTCPKGLPQDDASNSPAAAGATTASTSTTAAAGTIDPSIVCPATDKDGTPLPQSSSFKDDEGNEFVQCTYKAAGPCAFFFAHMPQRIAADEYRRREYFAGTTTQAAPPVTTSTTQAAPPPATTTSTTRAAPPATTSTTSSTLSTSTSTVFSTVQPPATTSSSSSSSAAFAVPPATTPATTPAATTDGSDPTTTFVIVTATSTPTGGAPVANNGLGEGNTNGAGSVGVHVLAMMPIVLVLGALL
ncbi:hypothetical protein B0H16DRAFT_1731883 [Mycena metata]|uniref:Uncharacterized protein n=1 Tax=Mycena metata TaxID=1033252 RepID=A0AAD7MWW5_9AGAR|nr:hypothetical protein B0H16DRAFT_1731883 [Mycena metata]